MSYVLQSLGGRGGSQRDWAPIGHSNNLLIKVPFMRHSPTPYFLGLSSKRSTCTQTFAAGSAWEETLTIKRSISAINNVNLGLGFTANHNLILEFCLILTRISCTFCSILHTVGDSKNSAALPEDGHRGNCWRHLVWNPESAFLVIYSSASYLTSVMISSSYVKR